MQVWVPDQDAALDFYTARLGMEVREDVTERRRTGPFRWLTVGPVGQPDISIALMAIPDPPVMNSTTAAQLRVLLGKGVAGLLLFTTDDCEADYRRLRARGVEFYEKPQLRAYGIDAGFRDPWGNTFRIVQPPTRRR